MLATDESALICDFAQFYGIYDVESIPCGTAAILACGLPPESRIVRRMSKTDSSQHDEVIMMLAAIFDAINNLTFALTGKKHEKRPESLLINLTSGQKQKKQSAVAFDSADDFERARRKIIGGGQNG